MPVVKLRQDAIRGLAYLGRHEKHQCIYWDKALPGFGLRVYASGRRGYVCSYRIHRCKRLAVLGRADLLSLERARKLAVTYLGKVAANEDPQQESERQRSQKTVAELYAAYVENHAKKKRAHWKNDDSCLRRRILPRLKARLISSIVAADIEPIHSQVGTQTPYAANHILEVVRNMFNWGKVAGLVPREQLNPTLGIRWFPTRQRRRYITTVEMPDFIRALEAEDNEYARHGLWLLLLTGLRSIELLKAKWADIDWDAGTLFVGLTKNGEPLLAPLSDAALARLRIIPRIANNPYIICGMKCGKPLTNFGHPLRRVLARAGLQNIRVHDLRRTVGSWLAQSGVSLHLIGDVLNHRDLRTTLGYAYFQTHQRREVLNDHGSKVLSLAGEHLLQSSQSATLSANSVLRSNAPPLRHRHYFRRESLHEIVWTAPVMEVAKRLGVSDVGLTKLCRRAAIPTPTRGYWARVESGQHVGRTPLPSAPEGLPTLLRIRGTEPVQRLTASRPRQDVVLDGLGDRPHHVSGPLL
jgi:integrase